MAEIGLTSIFINSGVTVDEESGEPLGFCSVAAHGDGGTILLGQLDPATVRRMAMDWLEAAEAAEQDAAVMQVCRKLDLPDNFAGAVIVELRAMRKEDNDD